MLNLKQKSYSNRRLQQVLPLSSKSKEIRLEFTKGHQNWSKTDWKNVAATTSFHNFQMASVKFGVKNMNLLSHPASYEECRLKVM